MAGRKEVEAEIRKRLGGAFEGMMKALYNEKGASLRIDILQEPEVTNFIDTHSEVLNSSMERVQMSDIMRQRLERSNYIFSGLKTFHELNEAFPSLIDSDGNRKPFEQFYNDVQKIDSTYNKNYLRAEYNFIQSSAEMAAKWEQFSKDGDRYYLQYRTAGDDKVRPEHSALNRVTLPIDDKFWEEYYPPNGWNCRCTVVQVRKSKQPPTPHDEAMALGEEALQRDSKNMFHFNPGKEERSVPKYNPYTISKCKTCTKSKLAKNGSNNEVCSACSLLNSIQEVKERHLKKNLEIYNQLLKDPTYKDVGFDKTSGGVRANHIDHNFDKNKGWYEKDSQDAGFKNGHAVIFGKEDHTKYKQNNCEGLWDNKPFEIAGAETATGSNIRNALKHCAKKTDSKIAVIYFPEDNFSTQMFNDGYAKFYGLKNTSQYKKFDLIYCIHKDKIIHIKKPSD